MEDDGSERFESRLGGEEPGWERAGWGFSMDVRDAMTPRPRTVTPGQPLSDAAVVMRRGRFRHLPVVDGGELRGVITERDLEGAGDLSGEGGDRPVRSVMTAEVITIGPDEPIDQAARLMLENKIGCVPVVEGASLVGIITESDIFRAFVRVLGVMEPGTRVQIRTDDLAAALADVAGVARARGVRLVSVVSEPDGAGGPARLVVRFGTVMLGPLNSALRAAGLDIAEPHPGGDGATVARPAGEDE